MERTTAGWVSVCLYPAGMSLRPPRSWLWDLPSTQEDPRARFFDDYRKEAEEYDKEFMKKYDEDLNTTLIFVSFVWRFDGRVLTTVTGWSVLRCRLRVYN